MEQIRPTHYNGWVIQEFIEQMEMPFTEGCIVKYVARWRLKGGVDDLKKSATYLERLIEVAERESS